MLDLILAIGDWWRGIFAALARLDRRLGGAGANSREADVRASVRLRTHGMRSRLKKEGDR